MRIYLIQHMHTWHLIASTCRSLKKSMQSESREWMRNLLMKRHKKNQIPMRSFIKNDIRNTRIKRIRHCHALCQCKSRMIFNKCSCRRHLTSPQYNANIRMSTEKQKPWTDRVIHAENSKSMECLTTYISTNEKNRIKRNRKKCRREREAVNRIPRTPKMWAFGCHILTKNLVYSICEHEHVRPFIKDFFFSIIYRYYLFRIRRRTAFKREKWSISNVTFAHVRYNICSIRTIRLDELKYMPFGGRRSYNMIFVTRFGQWHESTQIYLFICIHCTQLFIDIFHFQKNRCNFVKIIHLTE